MSETLTIFRSNENTDSQDNYQGTYDDIFIEKKQKKSKDIILQYLYNIIYDYIDTHF